MQLQDLEKVKDLSLKLADAQQTLDGFMASDGTSFPSYAGGKRGAYGSIELPAVSREIVLNAARAARDAIVQQLKDIGVEA